MNIFPEIYQVSIPGIIHPESPGKYHRNCKCLFKVFETKIWSGFSQNKIAAAPLCLLSCTSYVKISQQVKLIFRNDRVALIVTDINCEQAFYKFRALSCSLIISAVGLGYLDTELAQDAQSAPRVGHSVVESYKLCNGS